MATTDRACVRACDCAIALDTVYDLLEQEAVKESPFETGGGAAPVVNTTKQRCSTHVISPSGQYITRHAVLAQASIILNDNRFKGKTGNRLERVALNVGKVVTEKLLQNNGMLCKKISGTATSFGAYDTFAAIVTEDGASVFKIGVIGSVFRLVGKPGKKQRKMRLTGTVELAAINAGTSCTVTWYKAMGRDITTRLLYTLLNSHDVNNRPEICMNSIVGRIHLLTRLVEGTTTSDDVAAYPFELREVDANMLDILVHEQDRVDSIEPVAPETATITLGVPAAAQLEFQPVVSQHEEDDIEEVSWNACLAAAAALNVKWSPIYDVDKVQNRRPKGSYCMVLIGSTDEWQLIRLWDSSPSPDHYKYYTVGQNGQETFNNGSDVNIPPPHLDTYGRDAGVDDALSNRVLSPNRWVCLKR
jgi:hypothetical protein